MGLRLARQWGWLASVFLATVAYSGLTLTLARNRSRLGPALWQVIAFYLLAFAAYLLLLAWAEKRAVPMRWAWLAAVFFRLLLFAAPPALSDDIYRYLWDGHVTAHGISPYAHAIEAPELDYLDAPFRAQANNPWMASPYLPAAQALFFLAAVLAPGAPLFLQLAMAAFNLAAAWLLARLLATAGLPARRVLIYLWHPLVIVEASHAAHLDAFMICLALLAVWLTFSPAAGRGRWRPLLAPLALAAATLTKILPVLLLPVLFWAWTWRQRLLYLLATAGALLPFGLATGWGLAGPLDGRGLFGAVRIYYGQWNFNSGLFHWLERALGAPGFGPPSPSARLIALSLAAAAVALIWWRARSHRQTRAVLRLSAAPLALYVLVTPTLHPWYLLSLLAFLPFLPPAAGESNRRWLAVAPWLYLSGAVIFSYLTYLDPAAPAELEWVRWLEWWPALALLAVAALSGPLRRSLGKHNNSFVPAK